MDMAHLWVFGLFPVIIEIKSRLIVNIPTYISEYISTTIFFEVFQFHLIELRKKSFLAGRFSNLA